MTKDEKNLIKWKTRLHKLESNGKNNDSPGIVKKLRRKIMRLEQDQVHNE